MSVERTARRLMRLYPRGWRERYGEELEALVLEAGEGDRVPWRVRADVVRAAGRERVRGGGLAADLPPAERARGGALVVLWAWAVFVIGGGGIQKLAEHWQDGVPADHRHAADVAFGVLVGAALSAALLVAAGIATALPAALIALRAGAWPPVRRSAIAALALSALAVAATVGIVVLARHAAGRHDLTDSAALLAWGLCGAAALCAWTGVATALARRLALSPAALRAQAVLAAGAALGMAVATIAAAAWWVVAAPGSAPGLVVGAALLPLATGLAVAGARHATRALPALR